MKYILVILSGILLATLLSSFKIDINPNPSESVFDCDVNMPPTILHVKKSAAPGGDGSSWSSPINSLQDALDTAIIIGGNVQLWITNDTYYPDEGESVIDNDRDARFNIPTWIELYGGFIGTFNEVSIEDRNWQGTPTTLSGDIDQNDSAGDTTGNSLHVLYFDNSFASIVDGFVIKGGYSDGTGNDAKGGGAYMVSGESKIRNSQFVANYAADEGGAVYNLGSELLIYNCSFNRNSSNGKGGAYSNVVAQGLVRKCSFLNNSAGDNGGAIYNEQDQGLTIDSSSFHNNTSISLGGAIANTRSTAQITHSDFTDNTAEQGGAIYIKTVSENTIKFCEFSGNKADFGGALMNDRDANSTITNCLFYENEASDWGGGIYVFASDPLLINLTIADNIAQQGGGLQLASTEAEIFNTIVWGEGDQFSIVNSPDIDISNCLIKGGYNNGMNILNENPKFFNTLDDNYRLTTCSPAKDHGINAESIDTLDLFNQERIYNATIDLGAHEISTEQQIIYVDSSATGMNNGENWVDAYLTLQDALSHSDTISECIQIWVAQGTYYPDEGVDQVDDERDSRFELAANTEMYGGFSGVELQLDERDWFKNPTILSGDIDQNDATVDEDDNGYHVVYNKSPFQSPLDGSAILDGFHITGGNADGLASKGDGGGLFLQSASPTISNCQFYNNLTDDLGGAAHIESSEPVFTNCSFYNNKGEKGGAISIQTSAPQFANCSFFNNTGTRAGGATYISVFGAPSFTNCTFANNISSIFPGGAISNSNAIPIISNCIFWNNGSEIIDGDSTSIVRNSLVEGGFVGGTNIMDTDPIFVDQVNGNLRLQPCSPAIDQGDNSYNTTIKDIDNLERFYDAMSNGTAIIDLGAYELQEAFVTECITCPDSLTITVVTVDSTYKSSGFIKMLAPIPAGINITLSAPDSIIFGDPFEVIQTGTVQLDSIGCEE